MKNQFENSLKYHAHLAAFRHERLIREEEAQPNHLKRICSHMRAKE